MEKYCKYTANKAYIRADYNVEILIKKWQALTNFLASTLLQESKKI